ncbi:MAG: phosphodiesterase [Yoonia sp.]|uniref:phosphodiesterase n=1 Tax=Yoonia sp. TaxID=2212373 RepID=UPI00273DDDC0|nr:phosphodiesterase [Yoonia sp.]MDP5083952.1 phosphodiesterase [Yoonia sp.]
MQKILFLSDLHICAPGATIIGLDPAARLQKALDAALTAHGDAAALIVLGDLTHHGLPEEYAVLRGILEAVPIPIIPMLGNHDRREAFLAAFPKAPQTESGHIQHVFDLENHRIITLDSLDGPPYPEGHHAGRLCHARLAFLEDALVSREGRQAIVCIHHPPFATGIVGMDLIRLAQGDSFLDLLARHGAVHLICGHVHRTMSGSIRGVPWSMFKSPCHQGVIDLETPNSHLSSNEPGAYGLALLSDDGVIVHSEDVGIKDRRVYGGYSTDD